MLWRVLPVSKYLPKCKHQISSYKNGRNFMLINIPCADFMLNYLTGGRFLVIKKTAQCQLECHGANKLVRLISVSNLN